MKHNGFKNVKHVKGGIIGYAHEVKEKNLPNKFLGKNFVLMKEWVSGLVMK